MFLISTLGKVCHALVQQSKKPAFITAVCVSAIMLGIAASARPQEVIVETIEKQKVEIVEVTG